VAKGMICRGEEERGISSKERRNRSALCPFGLRKNSDVRKQVGIMRVGWGGELSIHYDLKEKIKKKSGL